MSPQSCFLYKIQPVRPAMLAAEPTPEEERIVEEHFDYLKRLAEAGVVLLAGRTLNTDYSAFGIVIFLADSEQAAQQVVEGDPAVQQRVMRAELYPYRIALAGRLDPDALIARARQLRETTALYPATGEEITQAKAERRP